MTTQPIAKPALWPIAMLAAVLALQATLVMGRAINWDEFYHYSQVQKLAAGTLSEPLQTLYTQAFVWVTALPGSAIDHIILIRWFMLGCELVTLAAIVGIARRFASPGGAWCCALAYAGAGYVFQHATSFRFDGPATAMLMGAAWLMLRTPLRFIPIAAIGLLAGTATVLTIKSVLYAPVFAGIAWLRWRGDADPRGTLTRLVAIGLASGAAFAAVYWLHASSLAGNANDQAKAILGNVGDKMFSLGPQPYWLHHLKGALIAPAATLLLLAFPFVLRREARPRAEKLALIGLALPLTTLLFYHNTAPYYFVFMLAPVCAALAPTMDLALARFTEAKVALLLGVLAFAVWGAERPGPLASQRALLAAAETMFPEHPAYFDSCGMLGTFPKANHFMTMIVTKMYLHGAYPGMAETLQHRPVPVVLANNAWLERALASDKPVAVLLPQDQTALRESYVRHWGPFWVAGRDISRSGEFLLRIPGAYRIEGAALRLDGAERQPGEVVELARGMHQAELDKTAKVRLVWAKAGPPPRQAPPAKPWFTNF